MAVLQIDLNALLAAGLQIHKFIAGPAKGDDASAAGRSRLAEMGVTEGDGAYVLGFPMGMIGGERNFVIVRSGCISRIRDFLGGHNNEFLVDAPVFPGNSGGPVILQPEITSIEGTQSHTRSLLIGIVRAYVPYSDVAVSIQTHEPRVIFQENSGLTAVHSVDQIEDTIHAHAAIYGHPPPGYSPPE